MMLFALENSGRKMFPAHSRQRASLAAAVMVPPLIVTAVEVLDTVLGSCKRRCGEVGISSKGEGDGRGSHIGVVIQVEWSTGAEWN